jgi:hypothetical protein
MWAAVWTWLTELGGGLGVAMSTWALLRRRSNGTKIARLPLVRAIWRLVSLEVYSSVEARFLRRRPALEESAGRARRKFEQQLGLSGSKPVRRSAVRAIERSTS